MANILDYVHWRGDLSFNQSHFNEIDNLILSEICYIDFKTSVSKFLSSELITLKEASEKVFEVVPKDEMVLGLIVPNSIVTLCDECKDSKRFGSIYVSNYINQISQAKSCQFSAMCFHLSNDLIYIAFRGTDDTLIGWNENLDMLCRFPVLAQAKAAKYIDKIASLFPEAKFIIGGHSKGGNLATYGAIYCDDNIKNRIIKVYNNDGPGFISKNIDEKRFNLIKDKIIRIIPKSSVVGLLFDPFKGKDIIVDSTTKGVWQHDGFSWMIDVKKFIKVDEITKNAKQLDEAITKMLEKLDESQRKELAIEVYQFIIEMNKNTLTEVQKDSFHVFKYLKAISSKNKKVFLELFYNFIKCQQI